MVNCFPHFIVQNPYFPSLKKGCGHLFTLIKKISGAFALASLELARSFAFCFFTRRLPCPNAFFSERFLRVVHVSITIPTVAFSGLLFRVLPNFSISFTHGNKQSVNYSRFLAIGISEEFIFRGLIQSVVCRKLPQMIIRRIDPDHASYLDCKIVRMARVIFTASLFALAHGCKMGDFPGFLLPQLMGGLVFGALHEYGLSLTDLSLTHFFYDSIIATLMGGVDL